MSEGCGFKQMTASGKLAEAGARLIGYEVVVITAVGAINIRERDVSGAIVMVIPSGTAAGARVNLAHGINVPLGIYVEYNGGATGTVNVLLG